jgi:REP element-mobilizing transposase RayT
VIDPLQIQVVHCVHRCVRRAFLCGDDPHTGCSYEHRREWIRARLEFLASIFGVDCLTYTVMQNHVHLVLRSRPDVVATWSDQEVASRWLRLFPKRRNKDGSPAEPQKPEIDMIVNDRDQLAERRRRLSDLSWWMRCTAENIARRSNREDDVTGHFWEGRYRAQLLLDEAGLLACAAYVDLNPIRAAMAETPEASRFTGAHDRLGDLSERSERSRMSDHDWERSRPGKRSGWLSPIEIDEAADPTGADVESGGRRASQKGFLSLSLCDYLQLLDWTGRQIREDKRGSIPKHLAPILARIGMDAPGWCDLVTKFGKCFKRAAGTAEHLTQEAERRGQRWMQSPGHLSLSAA